MIRSAQAMDCFLFGEGFGVVTRVAGDVARVEMQNGIRGAISLSLASVLVHDFNCRFEDLVNPGAQLAALAHATNVC